MKLEMRVVMAVAGIDSSDDLNSGREAIKEKINNTIHQLIISQPCLHAADQHNDLRDINSPANMDHRPPAQPSTAPNVLPRRSVTLPTRPSITDLKERRISSSGPPDPQVETLYFHSSARIVTFTTNGNSTVQTEELGNLPWSSKLERTIAIGMGEATCMKIQRLTR